MGSPGPLFGSGLPGLTLTAPPLPRRGELFSSEIKWGGPCCHRNKLHSQSAPWPSVSPLWPGLRVVGTGTSLSRFVKETRRVSSALHHFPGLCCQAGTTPQDPTPPGPISHALSTHLSATSPSAGQGTH
jgi:hypothetical protein